MPSGALIVFPSGQRPPVYFRRPGLGQEDYSYYNGWGDGGESDFYDPGSYDYQAASDYDVWLAEQGYQSVDQYNADVAAGYWDEPAFDTGGQYVGMDPSLLYADEAFPDFVPLQEEIVVPEEGFYAESINHLADIGVLGAEEAAAVINGELSITEALNISGYFGDYSQGLIPAATQQAVADAQAKEAAAKKAQPAAGGSGGGMSAGGGTPAQKSAQQQQATAKTPAEIAAAQKALAEANAAAGNWTEKDSLIKGVKNLWVVAGGVGALLLLQGGGGPAVSYTQHLRAPKKNPSRRAHRRRR